MLADDARRLAKIDIRLPGNDEERTGLPHFGSALRRIGNPGINAEGINYMEQTYNPTTKTWHNATPISYRSVATWWYKLRHAVGQFSKWHDCRICREDRDWPIPDGLTDAEMDYGNYGYMCSCLTCNRYFTGRKGRLTCFRCFEVDTTTL